jgi:protease II
MDTGEVQSAPNPVRGIGNDGSPDWSPDGKYLAYCSQLNKNKAQIIRIRTMATGQEHELKTDLPYFDFLRWCPDSQHLLITNFETQSAVYIIDIQTGEYTSLVNSDRQKIRQAELSPDGKTLFYRIRDSGTENWLISRDLETGSEKELLRTEGTSMLSPFMNGWALSKDGKHIAFTIREGMNRNFVLKIMSIEDGQTKTIVGNSMVTEVDWINDDQDLLFVNINELCRVSVEGGTPAKLLEWKGIIQSPGLHPDRQHLVFFSGGNVSEMWVMENFLPEAVVTAQK